MKRGLFAAADSGDLQRQAAAIGCMHAAGSGMQLQATAFSGRQRHAAACSGRHRQASASGGMQRQAAAGSGRQRQAAACNGMQRRVAAGSGMQRHASPPALGWKIGMEAFPDPGCLQQRLCSPVWPRFGVGPEGLETRIETYPDTAGTR